MMMTNALYHCAFTTIPPNMDLNFVNRTWIHPQKMTSCPSCTCFVIDHTIEDASVCDAASRVAAAIVSELRDYAAANVVELLLHTLVLKTIPFLDSTCDVAARNH
ncbi:hypothetical protein TNCV_1390161 [Trichonephila clavipes]|nr:hypothetical protein TNCV_1390161 [Trichonephila clavipes]